MSESTLSVSRANILQDVGDYLFEERLQYRWNREQTAKATRVIKSGERQFYNPPPIDGTGHVWSFMRPRLSTTISEPYETGTIAISSGTVTLTSGTWPSWAADGWLVVDGVGYYVSTRSSNSVIVLDDTSVTVVSGTEYELQRWQYTLPDGFGGFIDPYLSFVAADANYEPVRYTTHAEILGMRQLEPYLTDTQPRWFSVAPKTSDGTTGQRQELILFPTPTAAGTLEGPYYLLPDATTDDAPYPLGGEAHAETYYASIMAAAEVEKTSQRGVRYQIFIERLAASIAIDKRLGPKIIGYNADGSMEECPPVRSSTYSYNGTELTE